MLGAAFGVARGFLSAGVQETRAWLSGRTMPLPDISFSVFLRLTLYSSTSGICYHVLAPTEVDSRQARQCAKITIGPQKGV